VQQSQPLADRIRPTNLDDYVGQKHLVGEGAILRKSIETGNLPSFILWGPPGVGKTTLARIIANSLKRPFYTLSAISSGVKDVRETIDQALKYKMFNPYPPILFIDEIHRFNKSQQDSLLGAVENGTITLIGATTENPSFEVISALLSRCQVYILNHHDRHDLIELLNQAILKDSYLSTLTIELKEIDALLDLSGGDARKLLNLLEMVVYAAKDANETVVLLNDEVTRLSQQNIAMYDKQGEMHYDIVSAFIKSIRGSDPQAAVYWMARMIEGGEKPEFIARRMLILAAEDIGLANPNALLMANAAFDAVHKVGWPESRIILSEAVIFLATSVKSNSAYMAINTAQETVRKTGNLPVPLHLRNAPTKLMKDLNYGSGYKYAHDFESNFTDQQFLPDSIDGTLFYEPGSNTREKEIRDKLEQLWGKRYFKK